MRAVTVFHANSRAPGALWARGYYFEGWRDGWVDGSFENFFFQEAFCNLYYFPTVLRAVSAAELKP